MIQVHTEFITTNSANEIILSQIILKIGSNLHDHLITNQMTAGIIDNFEIINIQNKEGPLFLWTLFADCIQHMVTKGCFVQYLGKGIQLVAAKELFIALQDNDRPPADGEIILPLNKIALPAPPWYPQALQS